MKIIEYNKSYAAKVADMWNKSQSNWGNDDEVQTAEDVINREASSGNIKLYLAIDNDEVVGYCSFSEYQNDEGASYLPLLNVRPDYHGKKVGKKLILTVLDNAVNSRWPRFDLYTWSGNIKAMPLYKKCGFFWERKYDTVHLMNFIPYLYQSEALSKYLDRIDWYQDSKRVIDMEFDGEKRGDFIFYRYDFKNDNTELAFEFEQSSRGLRYISTDDYEITLSLDKHALVFNNQYEVTFVLKNKSNEKLNIKINGKDNKNIKNTNKKEIVVEDEVKIKLPFFIEETSKTQDKAKTYPVVDFDVYINNELVNMKIGTEPKSPIELKMHVKTYNHILNKEYKLNLDIENNLDKNETFTIDLPNTLIDSKTLDITLDSKEKRSIQVDYKVKDFGFYQEDAIIKFGNQQVTKNIDGLIKGNLESFTGKNDKQAYIVSGNFATIFNFERKNLIVVNQQNADVNTVFFAPQIGKPYSLEFSNKKPNVEFLSNNEMKLTFESNDFKDVSVVVYVKNVFGVNTYKYELVNSGEKKNLALSIPFWQTLENSYVPYKGKLLNIRKSDNSGIGSINMKDIDEPWFYNYKNKIGFKWDETENVNISGWKISSTKEDIKLDTNEVYKSGTFTISLVHPNVGQFREFSGYTKEKESFNLFEVNVNDGNPFVKDDVKVEVINTKKNLELKGTISVDGIEDEVNKTVTTKPGLNKIVLDTADRIMKFNRLTFKPTGNITQTKDGETLIVDNGVITFKADNTYSDSIYSLMHNGEEWLDSNYPTPAERAWWGSFIGGISLRTNGLQDLLALKEERTTEFVTLKDNFNNEWKGIKYSITLNIDEELKGITLENYSVTLPGLPVLHTFSNIINKSGKLVSRKNFLRYNVLKLDEDQTKGRFELDGVIYKCGDIGVDRQTEKFIMFESSREHKLTLYNKENRLYPETQKDYTILFSEKSLTIEDKSSKQLPGDFMIFTKDDLQKDYLKDLDNIKFEV